MVRGFKGECVWDRIGFAVVGVVCVLRIFGRLGWMGEKVLVTNGLYFFCLLVLGGDRSVLGVEFE
jgi:hypothetical protein